jgi:hypothetical protein
MAFRTMTAAVTGFFGCLAGPAAAGVAEFQGGRAGIPVACALFMVLVFFATCAGVFGAGRLGRCWLVAGLLGTWFWHYSPYVRISVL